ncbi:hypothetical protein [Micromonospora thermarum]|uniref:DUF2567 domain-containing protein n=1 Tax=Micromonospora thermarum TaxID=2720024 RepID=A0ABX0Z027_9ACTN|nr:hypothetical protein [Micromonospora thermarum]NJP30729.1 hypothetical protein [Micromonospora thermarum]
MTAPPTDAPVRLPRPRTVDVAFWLQLTAVLVLLGLLGLVIAQTIQWDGRIDDAARAVPSADPDEVRAERWSNVTGALFIGVPVLLLAVWYAATALPVRRGGNTARILVFVAAGAQLLVCLGQGCFGALFVPMMFVAGVAGEGPPYPDEEGMSEDFWGDSAFLDALYGTTDPFEAVLFPLAMLGVLAVFLLTAAVVLLLALPPAHRWFVPATPARPAPPPVIPPYGYAPPRYVPPGYAPPSYAPPSYVAPSYVAPGYVPPGYVPAPPGYLICPDPSAHAQPPASGTPGDPGQSRPDSPDSSAEGG